MGDRRDHAKYAIIEVARLTSGPHNHAGALFGAGRAETVAPEPDHRDAEQGKEAATDPHHLRVAPDKARAKDRYRHTESDVRHSRNLKD